MATLRELSPLPDPVGFSGMFAGVLGGQLVAGGGSQFRDAPLWRGGTRQYSDRVFSLRTPGARWQEQPLRLAERSSHFACAGSTEAIYLVGGLTQAGTSARCHTIRTRGAGLRIDPLPDLPSPLSHASAAIVGDHLLVCGGLGDLDDGTASRATWSLRLDRARWRRQADLPGAGVLAAAVAAIDPYLYLIGGLTFDRARQSIPSRTAYRYHAPTNRWTRLPDLPEPRGGAASPCPQLLTGELALLGGCDQGSSGSMRDHHGFCRRTLHYDPARARWRRGRLLPAAKVLDRDAPSDPGPVPTMFAPCAIWKGMAVVVSGEARPSVRTRAVVGWPLAPAATRARRRS